MIKIFLTKFFDYETVLANKEEKTAEEVEKPEKN